MQLIRTGVTHFLAIDDSNSVVSCRLSRSAVTVKDGAAFDNKDVMSFLE